MRINTPVSQREFELPEDQPLVSVTDLKGRITYCNAAFIAVSGYSEDELLGQPQNIVRHPDMPAEAYRDMWDTISRGRPWVGLVKNRRKDGDHYWVQANAVPIRKGNGDIVGFLSVRSRPDRQAVQQADALYARMRAEAEAGRLILGLRRGRLIHHHLLGRLRQLWRRLWSGPTILVHLSVASAGMAAATWLPGSAAVGVALVAALLGARVARYLALAPFRHIEAILALLASGDMTARIPTSGRGLVGRMQMSLNQLTTNLRAIVADTHSEIDNLRGAIAEIASGTSSLADRTEKQSASLEQTASTTDQINGTAQQAADSVSRAAMLATEMAAQAQRSQEAVQRVTQSMQEINASSRRVGDIIHVIEGVAFQTNILALNAAVEAARAGEQGRGFAVVASEVRALSQRTATAAREVKQLITDSSEKIKAGTVLSDSVQVTMKEALSSVSEVVHLVDTISHGVTEQLQGISQINHAITHLDGITQQNAAVVEEIAAASSSLADRAKVVSDSVQVFKL